MDIFPLHLQLFVVGKFQGISSNRIVDFYNLPVRAIVLSTEVFFEQSMVKKRSDCVAPDKPSILR